MKYQATKKIEGGKLVRIKIDADEQINHIQIHGDFFLHPEDAIEYVQQRLQGLSSSSSSDIYANEIAKALTDQNASFIGVTSEDLANVIIEAFQSPQE